VLWLIPIGASTVSCRNFGKGSLTASITICCMIVYPPPEYRQFFPGTLSDRIGTVLTGASPFNT
jgi:hypothetical protein